ncbi:hypothetical protein KM043_013413 [Ampulex compressa]|nr:hypothetical protein KM043_013413 [Ampulex compressa]
MDSLKRKTGVREGREELEGEAVSASQSRQGSLRSVMSDASMRKRLCVSMNVGDEARDHGMNDELVRMKEIGAKLRKFLLGENNKVSKGVSKMVLSMVGKYEEHVIRVLGNCERLKGRLDECEKQRKCETEPGVNVSIPASYASAAGFGVKRVTESAVSKCVKDKSYAVVVKCKNAEEHITSEQVKEKVLKNVSADLDVE